MKKRLVLAAILAMAGGRVAAAQPVTGFYVSGSAGLTLPQQQSLDVAAPAAGSPGAAAATGAAINGGPGATESGSAGWGFGNGLRFEAEGVHAAAAGGTATGP